MTDVRSAVSGDAGVIEWALSISPLVSQLKRQASQLHPHHNELRTLCA